VTLSTLFVADGGERSNAVTLLRSGVSFASVQVFPILEIEAQESSRVSIGAESRRRTSTHLGRRRIAA
jgi:hypothetical protein